MVTFAQTRITCSTLDGDDWCHEGNVDYPKDASIWLGHPLVRVYLLGYSDSSSFTRAYREWTRKKSTVYRTKRNA